MASHLTFLLNGQRQQLRDVSPSATLYQLLRARGLTGTKEGCAEGDCGACTVALGAIEDGHLRHRAVNSCILLAGQLQGKSVTTVEQLRSPDGALHPVQRAMADAHASQCGFCTPGFVMSLYAAYVSDTPAERLQDVNDLLAGNLCRCTGYGPIIDAARRMKSLPEAQWHVSRRADEANALRGFDASSVTLSNGNEQLFSPTTLDELSGILANHPNATIVSGATDVGLWITKQFRDLPVLVHIDRISELQRTSREGGILSIGAAVTYADLPRTLLDRYPDLAELVRRIGSPSIRNSGTVGGNIANGSPIGDMAPALIVLGSTLVLGSIGGQRRIPLEDFFIAYGKQDRRPTEFVEAIEIPLSAEPDEFRCYKVSKRFDQDISAVCGAFNIHVDGGVIRGARIAFGGIAGTPKRAINVEAALTGNALTPAVVERALLHFGDDFAPIGDTRASAEYRMLVAKNMLRRYHIELTKPSCETRLASPGAALG